MTTRERTLPGTRALTLIGMALLIAAMAVTTAFAAPAQAATNGSITNRNSGLVMDVQMPNTSNGAVVGQWSSNGGAWQQWDIQDAGGGYVNIVSIHSNKCLDVTGTANGSSVVQWDCWGGTNQQFTLQDAGSGYYRIIDRRSGRCLDVPGGSTSNGTALIVWDCHSGNNQQWALPAAATDSTNPVLPGLYADPNIVYMNGQYYLYPTTDGYPGWSSPAYTAWSSTNLTDWTSHGNVFDLRPDVSWAENSAWAPAVVAKNGQYYLYFSGGAASGDTAKHIGVAVSNSPTGPFADALGQPLVSSGQFGGGQVIDPAVFTDTDGQSYLYWGQGVLRAVPLNSNMTSFDSSQVVNMTPSGYNEAPFVFKRNNTYYLMWSENDTRSEDYRVAYATSSSPMGPWTNHGVILSKDVSQGILGTGHNSVVQVPGTDIWYIAYHRFAIPGGDGTNREVAIDRMYFNSNGTIQTVQPTL